MGVLSSAYADKSASRPFDLHRDGFVIAGGGGMLVLEDLEHARQRGAHIHAELIGYGAASDGTDMVSPGIEGAVRSMRLALAEAGVANVDYIKAQATSTRVGDIVELEAIAKIFGSKPPPISSTKGISGHPIAAAGVHEAIYGLLMMREGFLAPCTNLIEMDSSAIAFPLLRECVERRVDTFMSNSFGFGGTNASLIFQRYAH
jgi:3-oxoacyl-[acyl-carrier-protein] synthase-1